MSFSFHVLHSPEEGGSVLEEAKKIMTLSSAHETEVFGVEGKVDRETLLMMWEAGTLKVHVVKDGDKVVAYSLWTFGKSLMNADTDAVMIAAYVAPEYRGAGAFRLLLSAGKIAMSAVGATRIAAMVDEGSKIQKFFESDGARRISSIMRW